MKNIKFTALLSATIALMMVSNSAQAQWRAGGAPSWKEHTRSDSDSLGSYARRQSTPSSQANEGRVDVVRFVTSEPEASLLGQGPISITSSTGNGSFMDAGARRTFEAAILDALIANGYDTLHPDTPQAQNVQATITRSVVSPAESARKPVSGTAAMQVGTRGTAYGLGLDIDLSKPRKALISTRLDLRITHQESGKTLWEGYATIITREDGDQSSYGLIATKLARALFEEFPKADTIEATKSQ